jgi:superfamily II DNA or RNA helicase
MDDKVSARIMDLFYNRFLDNDFENIKIKYDIKKLLYDYQYLHVFNIVTSLKNNNIAIDGSATGTGKTYTSIAVCKQLNLDPIIICTRTTRSSWATVCKKFGVEPVCIVNYELLRNCKQHLDGDIINTKFLTKINKKYVWNIESSKKTILIFDEVHKCKNHKSQLGELLKSSKNKCKILMLSATMCDRLEDFTLFGYMLGFYARLAQGKNWIKGIMREDTKKIGKIEYGALAGNLFPEKGSRMMLEDIGDTFPKNKIVSDCYDLDKEDTINMNKKLDAIKKMYKNGDKLAEISSLRQEIERFKIPIILDEITKYYDTGKSVVVFVNFLDTLRTISTKLSDLHIDHSIIKGGQTEEERNINIELFQYNRNRLIVCTIQSGGESINLNDRDGTNPRVSIISPSLSSIDLVQAIGRIYRSNTKSQCLQKIIFCAGTYEERICDIIRQKSDFINQLSDDDLFG